MVCDSKRNRSLSSIWDKNISEVASLDIDELRDWLEQVEQHLPSMKAKVAHEIIKELRSRVTFLLDVGLNYLSLNRQSASLSGGESQRIRLATQIGSQLVNVLYILDEPSIGLHQRDNERLLNSLKELRDLGNTVIVVEHDEDMMRAADWIVDIGPKAGRKGGEVVFQGTPSGDAQDRYHHRPVSQRQDGYRGACPSREKATASISPFMELRATT